MSRKIRRYPENIATFLCANYIIGCIFFLGYYAVIDDLVTLFSAMDYYCEKSVSFVITLNYFVQFMKSTVGLFRDSSGTFYYDRWKPIVEGIINIGLSIGFVYLFKYLWGDDFCGRRSNRCNDNHKSLDLSRRGTACAV